jgi:hypothetical protein
LQLGIDKEDLGRYDEIGGAEERSSERSERLLESGSYVHESPRYNRKALTVAPFIPVPGVLQANVRYVLEGQQIENVLCFRYDGTPFGTAATTIWGILNTSWWPSLRAQISTECVNTETYMVDLSDEAGPVASFGPFTNPAGAASGPPVPLNAALCITHRTANRGRSYRGRTFIAGIAKSIQFGSYLTQSAVDAMAASFIDLGSDALTADVPFVVVSRHHNKAPRVTGIDTVVTLSVARDNVLDSQRRRTPGRGR